jgi:hypothetical protein
MSDPQIVCPNCSHGIKLTESLAAPLLEETRQRFNEQLAAKDAEVARKTEALRKEQDAVAQAREQIEDQVAQRLTAERTQLIAVEAKKARDAVAGDLQAKEAEAAELRENLEANNAKLAEAQQAQAELMRKERALADEKRELDLTVEKRVQASVDDIRAKAKQESDEAARLKVAEKDQTIESMTRTIEELKRKAEQGSQQSQGEVFEVELEELLRGRFPTDAIARSDAGRAQPCRYVPRPHVRDLLRLRGRRRCSQPTLSRVTAIIFRNSAISLCPWSRSHSKSAR